MTPNAHFTLHPPTRPFPLHQGVPTRPFAHSVSLNSSLTVSCYIGVVSPSGSEPFWDLFPTNPSTRLDFLLCPINILSIDWMVQKPQTYSRDGGKKEKHETDLGFGPTEIKLLYVSLKNEPSSHWLWSWPMGPPGLRFQGVIVYLAFLGCNFEKMDYNVLLIHSTAYWFYMSSMYIVCLHYYQEKQEVHVVTPLPQPVIPCCALWEATDSYTWSRDNAT